MLLKLKSNDLEIKHNGTFILIPQLVEDLFLKYYSVVKPLLASMPKLLTNIVQWPIHNLANVGVFTFISLINTVGDCGTIFFAESFIIFENRNCRNSARICSDCLQQG